MKPAHFRRFCQLLASSSLLLAANASAQMPCTPAMDAAYARALVGTWGKEQPPKQMEVPFQVTYAADGTFQILGRQPGYGENGRIVLRGTWQVKDCQLTEIQTSENDPRLHSSDSTPERIRAMRLETVDENGKVSVNVRQLPQMQ